MQFIYDNMAAALITMTVVLILLKVQTDGQRAAVDATRFYSAKQNTLNLVEMVDHDFRKMRATTTTGPVVHQKGSNIIEFDTQDLNGNITRVRYQWAVVDTLEGTNGQAGMPLYQIVRSLDAGSGWVESGRSQPTVTVLQIEYLDQAGNVVVSTSDAVQVSIRIVAVSPFGKGDFIDYTRWQATYRPVRVTA